MSLPEVSQVPRAREDWLSKYARIRTFTEQLTSTLTPEDCCIQSMPDASPARWHLAHTTWFFETFLLKNRADYQRFNPQFEVLFNSYYNSVGEQFPRARRGLLSRPSLQEVSEYRQHVDRHLSDWLAEDEALAKSGLADVLEIGLQHEQQHQELILTDVKHLFSVNPLLPAFHELCLADGDGHNFPDSGWTKFGEGIYEIGHEGDGFAYDNESPRHRVLLEDFELANRLVTNGEFRQFVEDGGYRRPEFWLSLGWNLVQQEKLERPFYWHRHGDKWKEFTLAGLVPLNSATPVSHVSYFEADAYARWAGARLPSEAEWEVAAEQVAIAGNFADTLLAEGRAIHPRPCVVDNGPLPQQLFGDVWEWTTSSYSPYPGYVAPPGALGEYNGKFMCNQYVLRGGSCATSSDHIRATYRNFFPPEARWQFSGFRLAR